MVQFVSGRPSTGSHDADRCQSLGQLYVRSMTFFPSGRLVVYKSTDNSEHEFILNTREQMLIPTGHAIKNKTGLPNMELKKRLWLLNIDLKNTT